MKNMADKEFNLIIAGSRKVNEQDLTLIENAVAVFLKENNLKLSDITSVVSGTCEGGDILGENWAKKNKIKIKRFPANWNDITVEGAVVKTNKWGKKYNAAAGGLRNQQMVDISNGFIGLEPDGETAGTADCHKRACKKKIPTLIWPREEDLDIKYSYDF